MKFHHILLPQEISLFASGRSEFMTSHIITKSGQEISSADCDIVKRKYQLDGYKLSPKNFDSFNNFFMARRGSRYGFFLKDALDHKAHNQIIGTGDGSKTKFELTKTYPDNFQPYIRKIDTPIENTIQLKLGSKLCKNFHFNADTKEIILDSPLALGAKLSASFEFLILVRFTHDHYKYNFCDDGTISLEDIQMQEMII